MAANLRQGSTFAGHRIDAVAGQGGMGVVYRATDLALDREVALKVIAPELAEDAVFRARFERECRAAAAIDHPHVVPVYHAGEEDGLLYVTMRFVDGTDLATLLREEGPMPAERLVPIVADVAAALDAAHATGLIHRDVKPGNVLISGERGFLTDFGVARHKVAQPANLELTQPGFVMGTADYVSPEQAQGREIDGRSDLYALACVAFEALTGRVPYGGETQLDKLWAHVHDPIPSVLERAPSTPAALDPVLQRALAKKADDRYDSPGAFAAAALAALAEQGALRVVVADDSMLLREGVSRLLTEAGFEVVAQAADGEELLRAVGEHRPDIAVTDIRMPPSYTDEGVQAALRIRAEHPAVGVLVLSQYVEERYAADLLDGHRPHGIGYLLKDRVTDAEAFAEAVREVAGGGSALDPDVVTQMLGRRRGDAALGTLSHKERQVITGIAAGQSDRAIAQRLDLDEPAVGKAATDALEKLGIHPGPDRHDRTVAVLGYLRA